MDWYLKVLKNYFVFSGRARRKEYWWFVLINCIISIVLAGAAQPRRSTRANIAIHSQLDRDICK